LWVTRRTAAPSSPTAGLAPQEPPPDGVDVVRRLVEDDQPAGDDGGHGERHEALDPARQLLAVLVHPLADVERLGEVGRPLANLRPAAAPDPPHEVDRLARGQPVEGDLRLGLDGADLAREGRVGDHVMAVDRDRPGIGSQQPHDLVDERRLAGAVVAEEAVDLAGVDGEVDPGVRPGPLPVRLGQAGDLEQHRRGPLPFGARG
jgi:hypothetical protein